MYPTRAKDRLALLRADFEALAEKVGEVRRLHRPEKLPCDDVYWCKGCQGYSPCPTLQILDGGDIESPT